MLRRFSAFFVLGCWVAAAPAQAQETTTTPKTDDQKAAPEGAEATAEEPKDKPKAEEQKPAAEGTEATAEEPKAEEQKPAAEGTEATAEDSNESPQVEGQASVQVSTEATAPSAAEQKPAGKPGGWEMEVHGYFRAPMAMGISSRPNPETWDAAAQRFTGKDQLQISYGPTRTLDSDYYSFAHTRLQEQDWAEMSFHVKKKHAEAVVGWMGYWYQGAGFRNSDAAWLPGKAYLTLDTDLEVGGLKPNIAWTVGAWWPRFGYFEKYDTYTLGQFRQLGEQIKLTVPFNQDVKVALVHGFGTNRDGQFNNSAPAPFQSTVGLDLIHYVNLSANYKKYVDVGLHYNTEWTRDPFLIMSGAEGKSYADARRAGLSVVGAEANLWAPYAGRLWFSPSYLTVRNGWALDQAGTEVMHSIGGMGIANNYMAYTGSVSDSTGSGSMINLGFLYENTLSSIQGKEKGTVLPEVTLNLFGLFTEARRDLPDGSTIGQDGVKQLKYGADVTLQALSWLGVMARYDSVNYDMDNSGYVFSAITPRVIFSSHFLSSERIYIQYTRYRYGDKMTLAGTWPWGGYMIPGSRYYQDSSRYKTPDLDVIRVQAEVTF